MATLGEIEELIDQLQWGGAQPKYNISRAKRGWQEGAENVGKQATSHAIAWHQ